MSQADVWEAAAEFGADRRLLPMSREGEAAGRQKSRRPEKEERQEEQNLETPPIFHRPQILDKLNESGRR